jgi:succinate dehydrogenase/fumarate reductase flavoprotein subunit
MASQVIVVGGGLAGLSAAHTVIERGGNVVVLEKNPFLGGNSTKATSGMNGALTKTQIKLGIPVGSLDGVGRVGRFATLHRPGVMLCVF